MRVQEINDKKDWNQFVLTHGPQSGAFLQSWEWGVFQEAVGHDVKRLGVYTGNQRIAVAQCLEYQLPLGKHYFYCPRGPIIKAGVSPEDVVQAVKNAIIDAVFLRFEPLSENDWHATARQIADVQPAHTLMTNLASDTEDILMGMHSKTRYNVRLSKRKGVVVQIGPSISFADVWPLFEETAKRGGFVLHDKAYFEAMLSHLSNEEVRTFLATAHYEDKILSANIMIDCNGVRTYLHGASSSTHRNVMAPYRLHWELMKRAKENGIRWYDWWGVAPEDADENHPLHGVTRFKEKFGGERVAYPGTFDQPVDPLWYRLYVFAKRFQ